MNMALLGLLGIGMPTSPQTPQAAATLANLDKLPEDVQELLRQQFTALLSAAETRLQPVTNPTKAPTQAESIPDNVSKAQDYFKTLAQELGEDVIAGIMPVTIQLIEELSFQQSFVAGVAFTPDMIQSSAEDMLAAWKEWLATPLEELPDMPLPALPAANLLPTSLEADMPVPETVQLAELTPLPDITAAEDIIAEQPLFTLENAPFLQIHEEMQIDTVQIGDSLYVSVTTQLSITPVQQVIDAKGAVSFQPAVTPTILKFAMQEMQQWQHTTLPALPVRTLTHSFLDNATQLTEEMMQEALQGQLKELEINSVLNATSKDSKLPLPAAMLNLLQEQQRMMLPQGTDITPEAITEQTENLLSQQASSASELSADGLLAKKDALLQQPEFIKLVALSQNQAERMTPTQQIIVQMMQGKLDGQQKITIQLYPEELGRVDVQLHIDNENNVMMRIITENSDAYDVLRADKSNLERILQEMGLKLNEQSLSFAHREGGQREGSEGQASADTTYSGNADASQQAESAGIEATMQGVTLLATTGVNIKV